MQRTIRRAVISVSDKTGLIELARGLVALGVEVLASGGTARALREAGCPALEVADYTGSPEILDGRVKTLHPKIHAGILARRDVPDDLEQLSNAGWGPIDLVVVNLYPFRDTVLRAAGSWPHGATTLTPDIVEQIDVGGPTMLRAAAKNFAHVLTVCDPADYAPLLSALQSGSDGTLDTFAQQCAAKVFAHTALYDATIAQYFAQAADASAELPLQRAMVPAIPVPATIPLRYGENPHQAAHWGQQLTAPWIGTPLQGKELSYNNVLDADAALQLINELLPYPYAAAIIKHGNPCGVGVSHDSLHEAFQRAWAADSMSAFGGIIVCSRPLDVDTARAIQPNFVEVILAPGFDDAAREVLAGKTALRLVPCTLPLPPHVTMRSACGGLLVQQQDAAATGIDQWHCATSRAATAEETAALELAWRVCKHVRSNAIVLASATATVGIGAGQMSRVDAVTIAIAKAQGRPVLAAASDAFFPFADGLEGLLGAGIRAIVQPGGAKRDAEVIAVAESHVAAMYLTGMRHFKH